LRITYMSIILFFVVVNSLSVVSPTSTNIIGPRELGKLLSQELQRRNIIEAPIVLDGLKTLPGIPDAEITYITMTKINETLTVLYSDLSVYKVKLVEYNPNSPNQYSVKDVYRNAFKTRYDEAIELFYNYIPWLADGVPRGTYVPGKPSGIKSLNIPAYPEVKMYIKPKLLAVFVGPSNSESVSDPVYVYYFTFETNGVLYPDIYTRVLVIVSVVIDTSGRVYGGSRADIAGYYAYGESFTISSAIPIMAVYGFLGILATGILLFVSIDEEYKYYLFIFLLFALQIFSFLLLLMASKTPIQLVYDLIIALNQWFIALFLLWTIPYIFLSYTYNAAKELEEPSPAKAVLEGTVLSISLIIVMIMMFNPSAIVRLMIAVMGPESAYLFIVFLTGLTMVMGLIIGGMWAKLVRVKELIQ